MASTTDKPVIGLIGGIGSGKSAVASALARRGGTVVAGDPAGHAALQNPAIRQQIAKRWPDALSEDSEVDRRKLGRIVFADSAQLHELESLVFPWIKARLQFEIDAAKADPACKFVVLDAAVMLEAKWADICDKIVFVDAPRDVRVQRVATRGWTPADLERRERSQFALTEKRKRADAILRNDSDLATLQQQADDLLAHWGLLTHSN